MKIRKAIGRDDTSSKYLHSMATDKFNSFSSLLSTEIPFMCVP